ncbi:efflux RND transporter periplasmic adaptor subunit [Shewanella sp. VB17]|nr:efflux RND transporter periplasmic adaptor subunit [Shewanella sp. VB17]
MKVGHRFTSLLVAGVLSIPTYSLANTEDVDLLHQTYRPVKVKQVSLDHAFHQRILPGEVSASDRATLSFRVAGEIATINVHPGEDVNAGDLLATLDPAIFEQQLEVAKAQFYLNKVLFERSSNLVEQGVVSRNDFDQSKSDYAIAQAALDKANTELAYTHLYAPYDGVISRRFMRMFEFTQQQEAVLGIQTELSVDVSFQLPEQFIGAVQRNRASGESHAEVQVKFDSRDEWFDAKLKELNTVADPSTGSYTIILTLPAPDELNVFPGMAAKVKAILPNNESSASFLIPSGALVEEANQAYVFIWLPDINQLKKVPVSVNGEQIVDGLQDGDWLVVAGASELSDGQNAVRWVKERGL